MKENTFLIIIIIITIIILFICEHNKDLIEGMVVFKWYDVNNSSLGPEYNQCVDSITQRIRNSPTSNTELSSLLTGGIDSCANTYLNQDVSTVKDALVTRFQAEASGRVQAEKLKDETIYEPEFLPDGSPNDKYGELKDDIKTLLDDSERRKAAATDCSQCPGPDTTITDDVIKTSGENDLDTGCLNKTSTRCSNCNPECIKINNSEQKRRNKLRTIESSRSLLGNSTRDPSGKENFEYDYILDLQENKDPLVKRLVKDFISERSTGTPSTAKCIGISSQYDDLCNIQDINETNCNAAGGGPNGNCIFYGGYERNNLINNRDRSYSSGQSGMIAVQNQLTQLQQSSTQQRQNDQRIISEYRNLRNLVPGCPGDSCPVVEGDDSSIRNNIQSSISQLQEKDNLLQLYRTIKDNLPQSYRTKIEGDISQAQSDPNSVDNIDTITKREIENTINDYSTSINNFITINEILPENNRPTDPSGIRNAITSQIQNYTTQLNDYSDLSNLPNVSAVSTYPPQDIKSAIENTINTCNTSLNSYSSLSTLPNINPTSQTPDGIRTAIENTINQCNTSLSNYANLTNLPNVSAGLTDSPENIKTAIENSINTCNTELNNYSDLTRFGNVAASSTDSPQVIRTSLESTINNCNTEITEYNNLNQLLPVENRPTTGETIRQGIIQNLQTCNTNQSTFENLKQHLPECRNLPNVTGVCNDGGESQDETTCISKDPPGIWTSCPSNTQELQTNISSRLNTANENEVNLIQKNRTLNWIAPRFMNIIQTSGDCNSNLNITDDTGNVIAPACSNISGKYRKTNENIPEGQSDTCCPSDNSFYLSSDTCTDPEKQQYGICSVPEEEYISSTKSRAIEQQLSDADVKESLNYELTDQLNLYTALDNANWITQSAVPNGPPFVDDNINTNPSGCTGNFTDRITGDPRPIRATDSSSDECKSSQQKRQEYISNTARMYQVASSTAQSEISSEQEQISQTSTQVSGSTRAALADPNISVSAQPPRIAAAQTAATR